MSTIDPATNVLWTFIKKPGEEAKAVVNFHIVAFNIEFVLLA